MTYILVVILSSGSGKAVTSAEFQTSGRCADAQKQLLRNHGNILYAYCFKK